MNTTKLIAWLTGILTLALATCAFVLSFNALTSLAQKHGVSIPPLFPFVVEFSVIIFSLNALYRSLNGESAKVQWALIISSSLLAGLFNVSHAQADAISRLMAAMPSLFLLLSFESFLSLVRYQMLRQGVIDSIAHLNLHVQEIDTVLAQKGKEIPQLVHQRDTLQAQIDGLKQEKAKAQVGVIWSNDTENDTTLDKANNIRQAKIDERRQQVLTLTRQGLSQADIANELGVSLATIKRDTKALNGSFKRVQ